MGTSLIFSVTDPQQYAIHCTRARWDEHVLSEHKSLLDREMDVAMTIQNPDFGMVFRDRNFGDRRIYYRRDGSRRLYIKAVVLADDEARTGELITAFHTASRPDGEKLIWTP